MHPAVELLHLLMPVVTLPSSHTHALSMQRLLLQFVLPALTAEFVDRRMIPFVLPNILLIAEGLTSDEYLTHVLPSLLPVFQMEEPVQVSTLWWSGTPGLRLCNIAQHLLNWSIWRARLVL